MLTTLRIKNLALVTDLTVELSPGYNAITGETGAGKSIIIGALNLALGERADRALIRSGAESCSVEAVFSLGKLGKKINSLLEENGLELCADGELIIKRVFSASGANRQFINGSPATLNILGIVGESLVDMHGPHEHQSLLDAAKQLAILDSFGGLNDLKGAVREIHRERQELLKSKGELVVDEKTYAQQLDLLRHQVSEISAAQLRPDEEEQVETDHKRASNAARLLELCQTALGTLADEDDSVVLKFSLVGRAVGDLFRLDPSAKEVAALHQEALGIMQELQRELSHYSEKVEVDPDRLQELEARLNTIHSLKRKYGSSIAEVIDFGEKASKKLESLQKRDEQLAQINAAITRAEKRYFEAADELSAARKKVGPKLSKAVVEQLNDLGFKQSSFAVAISTKERKSEDWQLSPNGLDSVEFQFAPNPGEPPKPLRAIASSGELARVMLALKTVLAAQDEIPVLVFDEVDANVGGETAHAVGLKMRKIGERRQTLCITHLAPVAAAATTHFVVSKEVENGRTISRIEQLNEKDRVTELARMLGGQGNAVRKHAESLLEGRKD